MIWATEVLDAGEKGFALMALGWGGGAVVGSLYFAQRPDVAGRGWTLVLAAICFAVSAILFAYSRSLWFTAITNVGLGVSLSASTVSASVIVQEKVVEGMRGRVMALFPLTNGVAMLLTFPISAFAQQLGLPIVVSALGWTTLGLSAVIILALPQIRGVRPGSNNSTAPG
ncbi:MAG TPA: hypothetical protein DGL25_02590 [Dehalococcoidia bacterium]|nr:hypothetical protein [Dehalococcoidia bacterium]